MRHGAARGVGVSRPPSFLSPVFRSSIHFHLYHVSSDVDGRFRPASKGRARELRGNGIHICHALSNPEKLADRR